MKSFLFSVTLRGTVEAPNDDEAGSYIRHLADGDGYITIEDVDDLDVFEFPSLSYPETDGLA